MTRLRIYLAGPISKGDLAANIKQGTDAMARLLKAGFSPFCPMLSCYLDGPVPSAISGDVPIADWYESDLPWVEISDAVLRLPGESVGADGEVALANKLEIPVYTDIEELIAKPPKRGDERFHALLSKMGRLHSKKQQDYGRDKDPFANIRASADWGLPAHIGCFVRMGDKVRRIQTFVQKGKLANESVFDSLIDLAVYSLIGHILLEESKEPKCPTPS